MVKVDVDLSGVKIPKSVGGVKLPKKLRKKGKKLLAKAQSPQGREAIAAGLAIAGTVLAAGMKAKAEKRARAGQGATANPNPNPVPPTPPRRPGDPGIDPVRDATDQWGEAITAGVGALQTFLAGRGR